jgi:hypothetical protein
MDQPDVVMDQVHRKARRARVEAINVHLFVPLARLCGRLLAIRGVKLYLDPRVSVR